MLTGPPEVLHLVGFLTGVTLFGMLLVMVTRPPARPEPFALATALLGLLWNAGELLAYVARGSGLLSVAPWIAAVSFTALGFLSAVVVHSVSRAPLQDSWARGFWTRTIAAIVYASAGVAGAMHVATAISGITPPSPAGLTWLTVGLVLAAPPLVAVTRHQANSRKALWLAALAFFGVSALHLGRFHGAQESLAVEAIGHHASLLLAFAILYQDYRFAFADLFLKHALTLVGLVILVFGGYSLVGPRLASTDGRLSSSVVSLLLAMWVGTALIFPWLRRGVAWFVDRLVLTRADYAGLVLRLGDEVQQSESPENVLSQACDALAEALSATTVTWQERPLPLHAALKPSEVAIWTGESPQYVLTIGPLAGGRRLLSDDTAVLDRVAFLVARRIDAVRLIEERYERMLQEREIRALATEAELRALRAQINPHFLFNALTTVAYLIQHAPLRAVNTLQRLTTLLRSVLRSEGEFTTLARERELIACYLKIERERFEERLTFEIDIPAMLWDLTIPSLIVQPLVENAIKHGISDAVDGGTVTIAARLEGELIIQVRNTGTPLDRARSTAGCGVGMENVARRLQHYYGDEASLRLVCDEQGATVAELRFPVSDTDDQNVHRLSNAAAR